MKKALIYWFAFLGILLWMTSCKSVKPEDIPVLKDIKSDSISIVAKDTLLTVPKDSSQTVATLGIEEGKVVVKQVNNSTSGRKLKAPKITVKDNVLTVDCEKEAEELFFSWKEEFIKSYSYKEVPVITNVLTWSQQTWIKIGKGLSTLFALFIIALLLRLFIFKTK